MFTSQVELENAIDSHNETVTETVQSRMAVLRNDTNNSVFTLGYYLEHWFECEALYLIKNPRSMPRDPKRLEYYKEVVTKDHIGIAADVYRLLVNALVKNYGKPSILQDLLKPICQKLAKSSGYDELVIVKSLLGPVLSTLKFAVQRGLVVETKREGSFPGSYQKEYQLNKEVFGEVEAVKLKTHSVPMIKPPLRTTGIFDNQRYTEGSDYKHTGISNVSIRKQPEEIQAEVDASRTEENCDALHAIATTPYMVNPKWKVIARLTKHIKDSELKELKKELRSHK